jgi:hypothetical protein
VLKTPSNSPISAGSGVSIPEMFIVLPSQTGSQFCAPFNRFAVDYVFVRRHQFHCIHHSSIVVKLGTM